mmetsp:Transcript_26833/g.61732  ORF Transcript_26833/g.61732 Transcript_26833/m.61732 type:complete len:1310 (-) Transcript_26833:22-3951(-)
MDERYGHIIQSALSRYTAAWRSSQTAVGPTAASSSQQKHKQKQQQQQQQLPQQVSPKTVSSGLKKIEGIPPALQQVFDLIPPSEKSGLLTASAQCPDLIVKESDPAAFLRKENDNLWAAARRMIRYWDARATIFGQERAFLPLNLSGQGALSPTDVAAVATGFQNVLPCDCAGRSVVFFDFTKLLRHGPTEASFQRAFFYIRSIVALNPMSQTEGYVGLAKLCSGFLSFIPWLARLGQMMEQALPITVNCVYHLDPNSFFNMLQMFRPFLPSNVVGGTPEQIRVKLESVGFSMDCIPAEFGGAWTEASFQQWFQGQCQLVPHQSLADLPVVPVAQQSSPTAGTDTSSISTTRTGEELNESDVLEAIEIMPATIPKMSYLQAMEKCPRIARKEASPKLFLRCEANDPKAAARRLLKYWDLRRRIFGKKRAFLPMDASGRGALEANEPGSNSSNLSQRYLRILPNDLLGRPVILWDRSAMGTVTSFEEEARRWFYIFSVVAERKIVQEKGIVFLALYKPLTYMTSSSETIQSILAHLRAAMPMAAMDAIVLSVQPPYEKVDSNMLNIFLQQIGGSVKTVFGTTPKEVADKLVLSGLQKGGIPVELGGEWRFEDDDRRQSQRDLLEVSRYLSEAASSANSSSPSSSSDNTSVDHSKSGAPQMVLRSFFMLPAQDIVEFLEAARRDPESVVRETSLARYLIHEKGNEAAAARKIARHWKLKKAVCGEKFTHSLVGESATCQNCAVSLSDKTNGLINGYIVRLPKSDPQGQDSFYIKDACTAQCENWRRGLFYALNVMATTRTTDGGSFCVLVGATHPQWYQICVETLFEISESSFPLKVEKVHLLVEEGSSLSQLQSLHDKWVLDLDNRLNQGKAPSAGETRTLLSNRIAFDCSSDSARLALFSQAGYKTDSLTEVFQPTTQTPEYAQTWFGGTPKKAPPAAPKSSNATTRNTVHSPSPDLEHHWLGLLNEAIAQLPNSESSSYLRAKHESPMLVQKESNPLLFLRFEQFNTWNAAKRLCFYWTERCKAFKELAYCPMNQTGEGALTKQDIEVLSYGHLAFLPPDKDGRTVVFQDASRLSNPDHHTLTRLMFYWYHILCQQKDVVSNGFVLICYLSRVTMSMMGKKLRERVELGRKAFPFKRHSLHIIPNFEDRSVLDEIIPTIFSLFPNGSDYCHRCNSMKELLDKLAEHGLSKEALPESIGGDWSYTNFINWQERQMRMEWELPLGALDKGQEQSYTAKPISELKDDERKERKRRYNILHSRRKRRRDRLESEGFRQQIDKLEEDRKGILQERDRLQNLISQAQQIIADDG